MAGDSQSVIVDAMQKSEVYAHACQQVELLETHISYVFLAGDYVYKMKKAVDFGFLDFSTLAKRHHFCEKEVLLNRRLAPDLYMAVVSICQHRESGAITLGQPSASSTVIVEYAVKMHRFDQSSILVSWMESHGDESQDEVLPLTSKRQKMFMQIGVCMAEFHAVTPRIDPDNKESSSQRLGHPETIGFAVKQNFKQIMPLLTDANDLQQAAELASWSEAALQRLSPVFLDRLAQGFVRECHGDLHAGNIAIIDDKPLFFDCIEFNDQFRCIDVISELAFLVMDLEANEQGANAMDVVNAYAAKTGDYAGLSLLLFYKVYRAMVRAKVSILRLAQAGLAEGDRISALETYNRYVDLATSYIAASDAGLLVSHGVSGTGKTSAARYLSRHWGAVHVRADIERKRLFGLGEFDSSKEQGLDIYTPTATKQTFDHLATIVGLLLEAGLRVVLDSTMLHLKVRARFMQLALDTENSAYIFTCQLADHLVRQRLEVRQGLNNDASEADASIMEQQIRLAEPLTSAEETLTFTIDMEDAKKALDLMLARL